MIFRDHWKTSKGLAKLDNIVSRLCCIFVDDVEFTSEAVAKFVDFVVNEIKAAYFIAVMLALVG